ncbi:homocysteine S-methyltransferase family protein [Nocardia transvalensis]|uniref:homocysteine S-methyltransferase family protein n=1 Tax=Nocardia transvalensis TaxID=37333 RepID=UPI0018941E8A|nr:homocysteine S-methyltransferase family protein [Nocardia transvalensis]MBF6331915.1 homocysteine S-methyltransferase family protein [Nocardia transvalensis]
MSNSIASEEVLLLDGGIATELQRAGLSVQSPWWATRALLTEANRRILQSVHEAYLAAGARVITANTFRANLRTLRGTRLDDAGRAWMVHAAIGVADAARREARVPDAWIAGSIGHVEDCYRPDAVPPDDELRAEHGWLVRELSRAGVELFLIETMNTIREARIALEQVLTAGGRAWVSFVCAEDGMLLSGEPLTGAVHAVQRDGAEAVLVNCTSPTGTEVAMRALCRGRAGLIGAYPNIEDRTGLPPYEHVDRALPAALGPDEFAELVFRWRADYGLDIIGGCCGTSPAHLAAANRLLSGSISGRR